MISEELRERVWGFLVAHNTLSLATVGLEGRPQAAAVFYAADEDMTLFFLSSPKSRHSQNLLHQPWVAATVQADGQAWQSIQGLQIEGQAGLVQGLREQAHAARVYVQRYDFLRNLLSGGDQGPIALQGPVATSRFYALKPTWMRLIDNSRGFGHREEWRADE